MLSSNDVSQMFAQQQNMFMGQSQYAQQIGVSNPNLSLAAWGTDPRQKAMGPGGTFGGHAPVSYGGAGMAGAGYGGGSKMAGGMMSLAGGVASTGLAFGMNPIGAFMGGAGMSGGVANFMGAGAMSRGIGAMAGGGMAGGALAAGTMMLPVMAAQKAIGSFVGGGQEQQQIQSSLSGFGFMNQRSRTGQGFSREDAQMIGQQVRSIAHIPEMMTSVEELTKLIPKLKASGAMAGVTTASEFSSRFKEAVKTLRDVSKVMGTTMEEASQFFEHSRSVGFLGRKDQLKNAMNVQFTAAQTGMSTGAVMQMQQGGAQMAVGRGIRRRTGVDAVTSMAQNIGSGIQSGSISQDDLEDISGVSGEGAAAAVAQQMTEKLARFAEGSSAGQLSMMALSDFDPKTGKLIGINTKLAQRYARGEVNKEELKDRLQNLTREQKIAASRSTGTMAMQFAGATGLGGASAFMGNVLEEGGHRGEEAKKYMMQKYGFTEVEVETMSKMEGMGVGSDDRKKRSLERKRKMEAEISERTDPSKIMARIGAKLKSGTGVAAAEEAGAKMFSFIGGAFDEFIDDVVGRYSVQLSEEGARKMTESFRSGQGRKQLAEVFGKAMGGPKFTLVGQANTLSKLVGTAMNPLAILGGQSGVNAAGLGVEGVMKGFSQMVVGAGRDEVGDDPTRQRDFLRSQFGAAGDTTASMSARFKELRGIGAGASAARSSMRDVISHLDAKGKFSEAGSEDQIRMIQEELGGDGPSEATSMLAPGLALYQQAKKMYQEWKYGAAMKFAADKNLSKAELAVALTDRIKDPSFGEASLRDVMKNSARDIKAAQNNLRSQLGDEADGVSEIMAVGGAASDVIMAMTSGDEKGNAIKAIMDSGMSSDEKQAKLKELGHDVSLGDVDRIDETHRTIAAVTRSGSPEERAEKSAKIREALQGVQGANQRKDQAMAFQALEEAAQGVQSKSLKDAMLGLGATKVSRRDGESEEDYTSRVSNTQKEKLDTLHSQLAGYSKRLIETSGKGKEKERDALLKELGPEMAEILMNSTKGGSKKGISGGSGSRADFAKSLGLSESDLGDFMQDEFKGGKASWTADQAIKAKAEASAGGALGDIVGAKEKKDKSPEGRAEKLNKTLDDLNVTMSKTNTLLAIQGGMKKDEAEKTYAVHPDSKDVDKK